MYVLYIIWCRIYRVSQKRKPSFLANPFRVDFKNIHLIHYLMNNWLRYCQNNKERSFLKLNIFFKFFNQALEHTGAQMRFKNKQKNLSFKMTSPYCFTNISVNFSQNNKKSWEICQQRGLPFFWHTL